MSRVYSGNGFTVRGEGMHSFRYTENGRSAILDGERLVGSSYNAPDFVLFAATLRWEDDNEFTDGEREKIIEGIGEALTHYGIKYVVE